MQMEEDKNRIGNGIYFPYVNGDQQLLEPGIWAVASVTSDALNKQAEAIIDRLFVESPFRSAPRTLI